MADVSCEVLIVGGSLGGAAAAIRAGREGATVCVLEETAWLGGQMTGQGVSTPDENEWIKAEMMGCTASYREFRQRVRRHYSESDTLSDRGKAQGERLCPGECWVNNQTISMEPRVGMQILEEMLALPNVTIRLRTRVVGIDMAGDAVASVRAVGEDGSLDRFIAPFVLDATDLGELLPLTGVQDVDWVIGAESHGDTNEPDAPTTADPLDIQPFTFPVALEHRPEGENHLIPEPPDFVALKASQRFKIEDGCIKKVFEDVPDPPDCAPPNAWWTYRRIIARDSFLASAFPNDLAQINTDANDFKGGVIPTGDAQADRQTLERGRLASRAYLFWLQTECPRDEGDGEGYPELRPRGDLFDTDDGLSPAPYIRESRRIKALKTIVEQEVVARDLKNHPHQTGLRAALFPDSCGIGSYPIDIHGIGSLQTRPFQISLGALIPRRLTNLLPACKNLGVTHFTNGAYRVHPVEWNVGEAAGALAVFCLQQGAGPREVREDPELLRTFQHALLQAGVPLFWWPDIPANHPAFAAAHLLGLAQIFQGGETLHFRPDAPLTAAEAQALEERVGQPLHLPQPITRAQAAIRIAEQLDL